MAHSFRSSVLVRAALLSTAGAALVVGCAQSGDLEIDGILGLDASVDSGKKDGRARDESPVEDSGPTVEDDTGTGDDDDDDDDDEIAHDGGNEASIDASADGGTVTPDAGDSGMPTTSQPAQGEIVISEVMFRPGGTEPDAEWFEVHNTTSSAKSLSGLTIKDKARSHEIGPGVMVGPGAYVVLVRDKVTALAAKVPNAAIVYEYGTGLGASSGIQMTNDNTGVLTLTNGSAEIARARYGPLGLSSPTVVKGQSIQLSVLTYAGAAVVASWCTSSNTWDMGSDKGTPGAGSDCL